MAEQLQLIILSGGFLAMLVAFAGGALTFFTPCVLPIVPPYLAYMTSFVAQEGDETGKPKGRAWLAALLFVLGFSMIFVLMGLAFTSLSQVLRTYLGSLQLFAGVVIFLMGLLMLKLPVLEPGKQRILSWLAALILIASAIGLSPAQSILPPLSIGLALILVGAFHWPRLYGDLRLDVNTSNSKLGLLGPFVMGLAFAFGWTACTGPILAAVLMGAGEYSADYTQGTLIMLSFAAGLGVPFILTAVLMQSALKFLNAAKKHLSSIEFGAALFLMIAGLAMYAGWINQLALWMEHFIPAL